MENNPDTSTKPKLNKGIVFALLASLLFGVSTPLAKPLLSQVQPMLLAGLFYLGSGIGLLLWKLISSAYLPKNNTEAPLRKPDILWLTGAIAAGGICGPILLMLGLSKTPASSASLLLNLEGVFTALLAWIAFKENCDRRIVFGMLTIVAGGAVLAFSASSGPLFTTGSVFIVGACFAWGLDNNLTRKVSHADPLQIAMLKGLIAGSVTVFLCLIRGVPLPNFPTLAQAALIGFACYGVSLSLFVLALRHIGTARTGAYFSLAPFIGAIAGIVFLNEPLSVNLMASAFLMAIGLWLHLTEHHEHEHDHQAMEHEHMHVHDDHHQHEHGPLDPPEEPHSHVHSHKSIVHKHPHFPDSHHNHEH